MLSCGGSEVGSKLMLKYAMMKSLTLLSTPVAKNLLSMLGLLQTISREINISEVLSYELSPEQLHSVKM